MDIGQSGHGPAPGSVPCRTHQASPGAIQHFEKLGLAEALRALLRTRQQPGQFGGPNATLELSADLDCKLPGIDPQQQRKAIDAIIALEQRQAFFGGSLF